MQIAGILLAAGRGVRFDPSGAQDKLLQLLPGGDCVAAASAKHLLRSLPSVQAVVHPGAERLGDILGELGCRIEKPVQEQLCAGFCVRASRCLYYGYLFRHSVQNYPSLNLSSI